MNLTLGIDAVAHNLGCDIRPPTADFMEKILKIEGSMPIWNEPMGTMRNK
jgi:hypothetical protein